MRLTFAVSLLLSCFVSAAGCNRAERTDQAASSEAQPMYEASGEAQSSPDAAPDSQLARSETTAATGGSDSQTRGTYGQVEASILRDGAVNRAVMDKLASKDFDAFMTGFERENATSAQAQNNTASYAGEIQNTLTQIPGSAAPARFACGQNVCIGSFRSEEGANWFPPFYNKLASGSKLPMATLLFQDVPLPGGGVDHRILFTTQGPGAVFSPNANRTPPRTPGN